MPADEDTQRRIATAYLVREVRQNLRTREQLQALSLEMFARMQDGTTVVEVTFEGGITRAQVNFAPHVMLAAVEAALQQTDPDNPQISERNVYADMSGGRIET